MNKLLTAKEAAQLLGVAEQTLAHWRCNKRRDLPFLKLGKVVRYDAADVQAFIQRHKAV